MDKIKDQYHPILWDNNSLKETRLGDLFEEYGNNIAQIIRSQNGIYTKLSSQLQVNWNLHLFNAVDSVNTQVIESFNLSWWEKSNKAIIAEIFWPEWIIIKSSIKVVTILEMSNINDSKVINDKLFINAISQPQNYQEFINWFCNDFYRWKFTPEMMQSFFYRSIILDK
jgi:hypothetical protein